MSDYFNTGEDPRFVFLENYVKYILDKLKGKKVYGIKKDELLDRVNQVSSLIRELRWSYLPKKELAKSSTMKNLMDIGGNLLSLLEEKGRELKSRDPLFYSELKFLSLNLEKLSERIINLPDTQSSAVDVVCVKVIDRENHPRGQNLLVTYVTDGVRNYKVVTNDKSIKAGEIIPLAILPPREFLGVVSEGMFVGGRDGIRRMKGEDYIGKRCELTEEESKAVIKEIFHLLK